MKNRTKKKSLYAHLCAALSDTSVKRLKGILRKRQEPVPIDAMNGLLLARFDPERHGGEVWNQTAPVGREFGAPKAPATETRGRG